MLILSISGFVVVFFVCFGVFPRSAGKARGVAILDSIYSFTVPSVYLILQWNNVFY